MKYTRRRVLGYAGIAAVLAGAERVRAAGVAGIAGIDDEWGPGEHQLGIDNVRDGIVYVPRSYKPGVAMPLVVMFHGAGSMGLNTRYSFPFADEFGFIVLAPDSRSELTWDLVLGEYGPDVDFLQQAFGRTLQRCTIDRTRMTVGGHSDGASYSLSFGLGVGDVFQHIISLSPGVMTPVAAKGKPKIFIAHGVSDTTMPIDDTSRKFVPRLRKLEYDITYREYDGGHGAPTPIVREAFEWLHR